MYFSPAGSGTFSQGDDVYWDMQSSAIGTSSVGGIGEFNLSDHGDFHFDPPGDMAIISGTEGGMVFAPGAAIGPSSDWDTENSDNGYAGTTDYDGVLSTGQTGIFGVRFQIGGEWHYGWVSITEGSSNQTINGWAYESTPNTPIAAGAGAVAEEVPALPLAGLLLTALGVFGLGARRLRRA